MTTDDDEATRKPDDDDDDIINNIHVDQLFLYAKNTTIDSTGRYMLKWRALEQLDA